MFWSQLQCSFHPHHVKGMTYTAGIYGAGIIVSLHPTGQTVWKPRIQQLVMFLQEASLPCTSWSLSFLFSLLLLHPSCEPSSPHDLFTPKTTHDDVWLWLDLTQDLSHEFEYLSLSWFKQSDQVETIELWVQSRPPPVVHVSKWYTVLQNPELCLATVACCCLDHKDQEDPIPQQPPNGNYKMRVRA